ncbi:hypothetical protein AFK68_22700 [Hydrocoleum sp. CS-953]|nr:hypothetical protein AFK68_22700 [Hydrocoleum sp. CS-953]
MISYLGASKKHQAESIKPTNKELSWNLKQIWERHKEIKKDKIAISTQKNSWKFADKFLNIVDCKQESVNKVVDTLLKHYSPSTMKRALDEIVCATNAWAKRNDIKNPWKDIK